ncbi:MAG: site-specific integrase [Planctomycetaceae bacterium]|nr:site-specific integrase [Planctomycetaceae bacterium]
MSPRDSHAGMLEPQGSGFLFQIVDQANADRPIKTSQQRCTALRHLARGLSVPVDELTADDLTSERLAVAFAVLLQQGMKAVTARCYRASLVGLGRDACRLGLIAEEPVPSPIANDGRNQLVPWSRTELERLFAAARTLPGDVAGIPAARWWVALQMVLLDTGLSVSALLAVPKIDYDRRTGTLVVGLIGYRLHARSVEALDAIRFHELERLLPWPLDNGKPPFHMLLRRYKELLFRAGLPHVSANLFDRLRRTARQSPDILDRLNFDAPLPVARPAPPQDVRRRTLMPRHSPGKTTVGGPEVYRIEIVGERTLKHLFETSYLPQRLPEADVGTIEQYRDVVEFLAGFLACDPTVDCLSDDLVERFLAYRKQLGRANSTINRYRCYLLALWRHAWRKKLVSDLPRDVICYPTAKRLPEAWSTEEVARILTAAAAQPGAVCGIPAGRYWVALILTLYDTGLRIAALMAARTSDLNEDGWLSVPAEVQKQDADQAFRLHADTLAALQATDFRSRELLFPFHQPEWRATLIARYRRILKRAGLARGRRDLFHKLRRTCATAICDRHGWVAAQQHLGHSTLDMTKRYVDPRKLNRAHTAADSISRPAIEADGNGEASC